MKEPIDYPGLIGALILLPNFNEESFSYMITKIKGEYVVIDTNTGQRIAKVKGLFNCEVVDVDHKRK